MPSAQQRQWIASKLGAAMGQVEAWRQPGALPVQQARCWNSWHRHPAEATRTSRSGRWAGRTSLASQRWRLSWSWQRAQGLAAAACSSPPSSLCLVGGCRQAAAAAAVAVPQLCTLLCWPAAAAASVGLQVWELQSLVAKQLSPPLQQCLLCLPTPPHPSHTPPHPPHPPLPLLRGTGFSTTYAVALSNITIVGGTLTNFAFNVWRRHPLRAGPIIDWDLILVMEPSTILGALAGGYINHVSSLAWEMLQH